MIFIIICGISLAVFFTLYAYQSWESFASFCFGFLGLIFGVLIGLSFSTLICITIMNSDHLTNTEAYPLAQVNLVDNSASLASNYVLNIEESRSLVYMIKQDTIVPLKINLDHIHFITTDTAQVVKNVYHFKSKICRLLFEYTSIYSYECYIPMQPLTSS